MSFIHAIRYWQIKRKYKKLINDPITSQDNMFKKLIELGKKTQFGKKHRFANIQSIKDYQSLVPMQTNETLVPYMQRVVAGEPDVLWPKKPHYFACTSGTTGDIKYVPVTRESKSNQLLGSAQIAHLYPLLSHQKFLSSANSIVLTGSCTTESINGFPIGRLSGLSRKLLPEWLFRGVIPAKETLDIPNYEEMMLRIAEEAINANDIRVMVGFPSWVVVLLQTCQKVSGCDNLHNTFPNLNTFYSSGTSYKPYLPAIERMLGHKVNVREFYGSSEAFFALQDLEEEGMLIDSHNRVFFEFIPLDEFNTDDPLCLPLKEVVIGQDYMMLISTFSGLYRYCVGDIVRFTSVNPYRIVVRGRMQHELNIMGEHIRSEHVEKVMAEVVTKLNITIHEFTVAPSLINEDSGLFYHQWLIELPNNEIINLPSLAAELDKQLMLSCAFYQDFRTKGELDMPIVTRLPERSFYHYLANRKGKVDSQQKIPRVTNDRDIANFLLNQAGLTSPKVKSEDISKAG